MRILKENKQKLKMIIDVSTREGAKKQDAYVRDFSLHMFQRAKPRKEAPSVWMRSFCEMCKTRPLRSLKRRQIQRVTSQGKDRRQLL